MTAGSRSPKKRTPHKVEIAACEPFLTLREVAEALRLHPRTVREYVRRGELVGRLIGRRWRFKRRDLDAFFEAAPSQWEFRRKSDGGE